MPAPLPTRFAPAWTSSPPLLLLLLGVILRNSGATNITMRHYFRVELDEPLNLHEDYGSVYKTIPCATGVMGCGTLCNLEPWCCLFWIKDGVCILTNWAVLSSYSSEQPGPKQIAYTSRSTDFAFRKQAHVKTVFLHYSGEAPLDGIYKFDNEDCYMSTPYAGGQYFVVDLGEPRYIREVRIITPNSAQVPKAPVDIRVGQTLEGFSHYETFVSNYILSRDTEEIFTGGSLIGRYVGVFRGVGDNWLEFCHLEVR